MRRREDVIPGATVTLKGRSYRLIEHQPSYRPDRIPYITEESPNPVQDSTCYIWTRERWLVEEENTGFRTHRYVSFFMFIRTKYPSGCIRSEFEDEGYEEDEKDLAKELHDRLYHDEEE